MTTEEKVQRHREAARLWRENNPEKARASSRDANRRKSKERYARDYIGEPTDSVKPSIKRDEVHNASDIMHATPDQAVRMLNAILSGRDVFVGVR